MGILYLCSCILGILLSGATSSNGEAVKVLGQDQQETVQLWNTLFNSNFTISGDQFSSQFRPPSDSKESPEPTVVDVSLKNVKVLNYGSGHILGLQGTFVIEYLDKRLTYEPINKRQKYIKIPSLYKTETHWSDLYNRFRNTGLWLPTLEVRGEVNSFHSHVPRQGRRLFDLMGLSSIAETKSFVTPQGHVYVEINTGLSFQAPPNTSDVYSLKLVETQNPIEDVQIRWKSKDPVTFLDNLAEVEDNESKNKYHVSSATETCKEVESFGEQIGQVEYSCAKLILTLSKHK